MELQTTVLRSPFYRILYLLLSTTWHNSPWQNIYSNFLMQTISPYSSPGNPRLSQYPSPWHFSYLASVWILHRPPLPWCCKNAMQISMSYSLFSVFSVKHCFYSPGQIVLQVKHGLLPVRVRRLRGRGEPDLLVAVGKLNVEKCNESLNWQWYYKLINSSR